MTAGTLLHLDAAILVSQKLGFLRDFFGSGVDTLFGALFGGGLDPDEIPLSTCVTGAPRLAGTNFDGNGTNIGFRGLQEPSRGV